MGKHYGKKKKESSYTYFLSMFVFMHIIALIIVIVCL